MPFPLAHPAAVWPLRRWHPRRLITSALVIGSLVPDLGYLFPRPTVARWSHTFWSGSVGFSLPIGIGLFWLLRIAYPVALRTVPAKFQTRLQSVQSCPVVSWPALLASVLIGAWTHVVLDAITHADGWIAMHVPALQRAVFQIGPRPTNLCELLYYLLTFFGVAYLAFWFLHWFEYAGAPSLHHTRVSKLGFAILVSVLSLFLSAISRGAL